MILIRHLQMHLKARRKQPQPSLLLDAANQTNQPTTQINLTQKGIILQLLATVCLHQFQVFKKRIQEFLGRVQAGNTSVRTKTHKKMRREEAGKTTTVRRKRHQAIETTRTAQNLDQMLLRQLSTPSHTQPKSQMSNETFENKWDELIKITPLSKIETVAPLGEALIPIEMLTPIKDELSGECIKLDQYRLLMSESGGGIKSTKNREGAARTRKKGKQTQIMQEQINTDISLNLCSQVSLRKEIEVVLQTTKKKKTNEKQNMFSHFLFEADRAPFDFHPGNKNTLRQFYQQFAFPGGEEPGGSQSSNLMASPQQHGNVGPVDMIEVVGKGRAAQIKRGLDSAIKSKKHELLSNIEVEMGLKKEDKCILFYTLLCDCEEYDLKQADIDHFGDIWVSRKLS